MPATVLSTAEAAQLNTLRVELKQWEKSFSDANGGKKAGRQDIKQDPEIAAKYKTYGRLRALESSSSHPKSESRHNKEIEKTPSKSDSQNARAKRKHAAALGLPDGVENEQKKEDHHHTPKKSRGNLFTPAKNRTVANDPHHPAALDPYDSPSVFRRLFSPSTHRQTLPSPVPLKSSIGPTPQRDGTALGLFDLLSASGGSTATPSAKRMTTIVGDGATKTPSGGKRKRLDGIAEKDDDQDDDDDQMIRMGRTPASSSKKLYLERLFATPTTMRFATMVEDDEERQLPAFQKGPATIKEEETRTETNPLSSETPSFLRRSNSGRYIPNADPSNGLSPVGVRKPQRFVGKGLSALVQGLRDMEEERMQDDWDVLKELEAEQDPNGPPGGNVQVGDSQVATTDHPEGGRIWKKKAPKRTTRLVRLKPVMQTKPKTTQVTTNPPASEQNEDEEEEDPEDFIPDDDSDDSDFAESTAKKPSTASSFSEKIKAMISDVKNKNPLANATSKANNTTTASKADNNAKSTSAEKAPKKRKVNPDAHANYRSLKIRSRGQGRFGRRFGRR